jgi:hypothetical protein
MNLRKYGDFYAAAVNVFGIVFGTSVGLVLTFPRFFDKTGSGTVWSRWLSPPSHSMNEFLTMISSLSAKVCGSESKSFVEPKASSFG